MLNPVSLRNGHGSLCLYSGILSSRAGTAAIKTIPIHDLVSDIIKGRTTAGITVHGPSRLRPVTHMVVEDLSSNQRFERGEGPTYTPKYQAMKMQRLEEKIIGTQTIHASKVVKVIKLIHNHTVHHVLPTMASVIRFR